MGAYSELVKTFSCTRDYVRDFFIYGCKVREEFSRKSTRSYDNERRRVESWLGKYFRNETTKRGRQFRVSVDSGHIAENPLYQAYYAKSFTDNDIQLHFLLLDLLADGQEHTVSELTEHLYKEYNKLFEERSVRLKLREYALEGLVCLRHQGRSYYFRLSPDTLSGLAGQFPGLTDAIRFFSEIQPFGVIGNSILRSERLRNKHFLMKHNYIVRTLEDEVLVNILDAMHKKCWLRVTVFRSTISGSDKERAQMCLPLCINTSSQTGRRYLIAYQPEFGQFKAYRLDYIKAADAVPDEKCPDYDTYAAQLREALPHVFSVSFGKAGEHPEPLHVTLHIPRKESYVLTRLQRECRCGTVEQVGKETYCVTLDLYDPQEAFPWIRTFTCRILSLEGGTEELRQLFRDDLYAMAQLYEEENHDDIS